MPFTRDWDEARPADTDLASSGDDEMRYIRVDTAERLKTMFYGLTAGENTHAAHAKQITFREQGSMATPDADTGALYCKEVGGKCELHWLDEDANEKQLTSGGKLNIAAADIAADLLNDTQLRGRNNQPLRWRNAAGTADVNGPKVNASDKLELPDGSQLATSAAPTTDAQLVNKKYVDDTIPQVTKSATAAKIVHASGLIEQVFQISSTSDTAEAFTFPEAFSTACIGVWISHGAQVVSPVSKTGFTINRYNTVDNTVTFFVRAIGY